jgi:hypothetical protein
MSPIARFLGTQTLAAILVLFPIFACALTVTYLPGGASLPHRHDAQVFVYVLVIVADAQGKIVQRIEPSDAPSLSKALDQL